MDNDQDDIGKAVIIDLHGGDIDDDEALAEFQEIKDVVMKEVSVAWSHSVRSI